jgi:hypothetical protein
MPRSLVDIYGFFGDTGYLQRQSGRLSKREFEILTDLNFKWNIHNQIYKLTLTEMANNNNTGTVHITYCNTVARSCNVYTSKGILVACYVTRREVFELSK